MYLSDSCVWTDKSETAKTIKHVTLQSQLMLQCRTRSQ